MKGIDPVARTAVTGENTETGWLLSFKTHEEAAMAGIHGADLEALAQLARELERNANRLNQLTNAASAGVNSLPTIWGGPDAVQFRQLWQSTHRPKLLMAATELGDAAATVTRNRQAQETTSANDGSGVGGGGAGGPGVGGGSTQADTEGGGSRVDRALSWLGVPDLPEFDIGLPNLDLSNPGASIPRPTGFGFGLPGIDLPDLNLPDIDLPDLNLPDVDVPDIRLPGIGLPQVPDIGVPGVISDTYAEGRERLDEYGEYLGEANQRREDRNGPFWFANPGNQIDAIFEDGAAAVGILGLDGQLYHGDDDGYCGGSHSCITGVATPLGGAITLGHTVLYTPDIPQEHLIAHEQQHVYQYEEHGTLGFLGRWATSGLVDIALGGDGYLDTDHEREGYYVQDHYGEGVRPSPDLVVPEDYYPSDTRDYNFTIYPGNDRPDFIRDLSAEITELIWL